MLLAGPIIVVNFLKIGKWSMFSLVPGHKKGSKTNVENCRPISLINLVGKTLGPMIRDEIVLKYSRLIDQRHHGFIFGKSCGTHFFT